jgi:hypothetical protein
MTAATAPKPLNTTNKLTEGALSGLIYWLWEGGSPVPTRDEIVTDYMEEEIAEIAARYSLDIEGMTSDQQWGKVWDFLEFYMVTNEVGCPMYGRPDMTGILYKRF